MKEDIKALLRFQKDRDWKQFHSPRNLATSLAVEAGEVLEIFQWAKDNKLPAGKKKQLAEEIADVYTFLLLLAHESGIDIKKVFKEKMKLNEKKYPVGKAKGSSRKYSEL